MSRTYLYGDSHTHALSAALAETPQLTERDEVSAKVFRKTKNGRTTGDIDFDETLTKFQQGSPDDVIVSVVGGNLYHMLSLARHSIPFEIVDDTVSSHSMTVIPSTTFRAALRFLMEKNELPRLRKLAAAAKGHVLHISAPPPPPSR